MLSLDKPARVTVALPAYNEEQALGTLLDRLCALVDKHNLALRVIVVNDGSVDSTHSIAENHRLALEGRMLVIDHPRNLGLPAAICTAIEWFVKEAEPDDILVTMDADDTHDPEEIMQMLERIEGGADIVIGSRFQPGARVYGVSPMRRVLSQGVLVFMRLLTPLPGVRDYSCGFRMYSARILEEVMHVYGNRLIQTNGFSVQSELLIKCAAKGARIEEVPMVLHYDRKIGKSKINMGNTLAGYVRLISIYRSAFREKNGGGEDQTPGTKSAF